VRKVFPPVATAYLQTDEHGLSFLRMILPYIEQSSMDSRIDDFETNQLVRTTPMSMFLCPSCDTEYLYPRTDYCGVMGAKDTATCPTPPGYLYEVVGNRYRNQVMCGGGGHATTGVMTEESANRIRDITDGTSHTLLVGEYSWDDGYYRGFWAVGSSDGRLRIYSGLNVFYPLHSNRAIYPTENPGTALCNDLCFGSNHPGGAQFALADGSVQFIFEEIDLDIYRAMATMACEEVFSQ
jgi:prepilin-type processing-associated H-X9-DG protein